MTTTLTPRSWPFLNCFHMKSRQTKNKRQFLFTFTTILSQNGHWCMLGKNQNNKKQRAKKTAYRSPFADDRWCPTHTAALPSTLYVKVVKVFNIQPILLSRPHQLISFFSYLLLDVLSKFRDFCPYKIYHYSGKLSLDYQSTWDMEPVCNETVTRWVCKANITTILQLSTVTGRYAKHQSFLSLENVQLMQKI